MKINHWLRTATDTLEKSGINTARLDALVLLEGVTAKDRSWLLANPEFKLSDSQLKTLHKQINLRAKHMPLAYIRGKTEFYGREFLINENVLEPRPESETMIDMLKDLELTNPTIADIGTGSGALAITAKLEIPFSDVVATDIDPKCLKVSEKNANTLKAEVELKKGDLLEPFSNQKMDILLCNLPYVPDDWQINEAAMQEPRIAIFGGPDGLDLYRQLFQQIDKLSYKPKYILCESLPPQHKKLASIAKQHGYKLTNTSDFIELFRI